MSSKSRKRWNFHRFCESAQFFFSMDTMRSGVCYRISSNTIFSGLFYFRFSRQFHKEISTKRFHYAGFFTIILTERIQQTFITQIFRDCWEHRMINVNVLQFEQSDRQVYAYTYFPYASNHCELIKSTFLLSMKNQSISMEKDFFPNKIRNFHKCPLFLATYAIPPYMILQQTGDGTHITKGTDWPAFLKIKK